MSRHDPNHTTLRSNHSVGRILVAIAAAWVLSIGFDLFLHAGLLAHLYAEPSAFLLEPEDAFRRIPIGYLSFLILTIGLYLLFDRLGIRGWQTGFGFGLCIGMIAWGTFLLGLYSISTAAGPLLIGWWLGQSFELAIAGTVLGTAAANVSLKRIWAVVATAVVVLVALTIVLQSTGWAPPMRVP